MTDIIELVDKDLKADNIKIVNILMKLKEDMIYWSKWGEKWKI